MGVNLDILCGNLRTGYGCGKFYGYCKYQDAKESFDFLIELFKAGKIKPHPKDIYTHDAILYDIANRSTNEEMFYNFSLGSYFGIIIPNNEDFKKFIDLHNKDAYRYWKCDLDSIDNWQFAKDCKKFSEFPHDTMEKTLWWG